MNHEHAADRRSPSPWPTLLLALLVGQSAAACGHSSSAPSSGADRGAGAGDGSGVQDPNAPRAAFTGIMPKAQCAPDDRVETGLQGQVPVPDRLSGRAALGYNCNLDIVGEYKGPGFANLDSYGDCVYYSDNTSGAGAFYGQQGFGEGGGVVLDVSDPAHPVKTDYLTAWAMQNAGESLRVHQKRGLLVANYYTLGTAVDIAPINSARSLAVYDVSQDCRHPKLLANIKTMPTATGHEGCFQPDGMIYYMNSTVTVTAIDLTDPANPKELSPAWRDLGQIHGCSISDDGTRGYFANINGSMDIVDTSQIQARVQGTGAPKLISRVDTTRNGLLQQSTIPVSYHGHPYVVDFPEIANLPIPILRCVPGETNFSYARIIDIADETQPKEVSKLKLEVHDPKNCLALSADYAAQTQGADKLEPFTSVVLSAFLYDVHYCRTDRLHDPTILACAQFISGIRVFDIRDPYRPKEIAYYNTGTNNPHQPLIADYTFAPPVIRRDLGQIWWVSRNSGFHAAKFRAGVWPFPGDDPCPGEYDYYAEQYDSTYAACRARKAKSGATG